jgi:hypothetical protein
MPAARAAHWQAADDPRAAFADLLVATRHWVQSVDPARAAAALAVEKGDITLRSPAP